jgi:short-subunit dehydrogenase
VVEKPEDVAQAIWEAIAHQKAEVIVGSANLSVAASRLFPNLMQWVFRKTFQLKDQT